MNKHSTQPLRVGVLEMDDRSVETLKMYFRGPCKNSAVIVDIQEAQISLIDMDKVRSKKVLTQHRQQHPDRPLIQLSLVLQNGFGPLCVKKPFQVEQMVAALNEARDIIKEKRKGPVDTKPPEANSEKQKPDHKPAPVEKKAKPKGRTHKTAMLLDDTGFKAYIGSQPDIDPIDPEQVKAAHYNSKSFLQEYVQKASTLALSKDRILRLETGWKPITIFPQTREVWVDAEDAQLRAACCVPISRVSGLDLSGGRQGPSITISAVNGEAIANTDPSKFQLMDGFLWKVALWTSRGRVPDGIDLKRPVVLRQWPNMTRLVIIPHALRIAALMMERPRTLLEVAEELQIRQQYVFAFFSAAYALRLANQAKLSPAKMMNKPPMSAPKQTGLLKKVLGKLRIN